MRVPGVGDPAVRLDAVVGERSRMRGAGRGGSAALLTPAFRALAAVGAFQAFVDHQRLVHTFVTNVRGPTGRLRLAGAEVTHVVPVAVNPGNVVVSFDVLSYAGELVVTLVCDPDAVPESAWLAAGGAGAACWSAGSLRATGTGGRTAAARPSAGRCPQCALERRADVRDEGAGEGRREVPVVEVRDEPAENGMAPVVAAEPVGQVEGRDEPGRVRDAAS